MRSAHPGKSAQATQARGARILAITAAATTAALLPVAARADGTLGEIVVTAQRQTERLQDVPIAITALSGADLESRGVRQAGDITASVPNMLLNSPYGPEAQPTFTLRGVTTQDFSENQSSPIAMYVDEVYKSVGAVQALQVYDLDRVEVLRGPQGTLYGKNATGGAVNFYSKNPSLSEYDGYVTAGVSNYSGYSLHAAVGGPIVDNQLGWRAAILSEKRDGWVHSIVPGVEPLNGVDALAGRFTLLCKPNDNLTAQLKIAVSRSGGTPYGTHALNNNPAATGFSGNIDWFSNAAKFAVHKDIRNDSVSLKLDWKLSEHYTLTSVTGLDYGRWYEKSDDGGLGLDDTGAPIRIDDPNTYFSSVNSFSQELRLASRDLGAANWLAGLYYGRDTTHATVQFHFFDGFLGGFGTNPANLLYGFDEYNNFDQVRDSTAAFFNVNIAVAPTVTLRAGLRYTKDKLRIENFYALQGGLGTAPGAGAPPVGLTPDGGTTWWTQTIPVLPTTGTTYASGLAPQGPRCPDSSGTVICPNLAQDNSNVSGRVGVDWKPGAGLLAYASFSRGYRGAAFNGQAYDGPVELTFANPERLDSLEVGVKAIFWDKRAEIDAAVFHYDYRNQQFLENFPLPGGTGTGFRTKNAPKSRVNGGELELRMKATEDLEIRASLGVLDGQYVELSLLRLVVAPATSTLVNLAGNKLIQAPNYSANVAIDWRIVRTAAGDLRLQFDANYYAKQYFDALNTERIAQAAYGIANARVALDATERRGFSAGAWVKNLANRRYLAYGLAQRNLADGSLGFDYALVGEPRTYGLDLTYRF